MLEVPGSNLIWDMAFFGGKYALLLQCNEEAHRAGIKMIWYCFIRGVQLNIFLQILVVWKYKEEVHLIWLRLRWSDTGQKEGTTE
jgi:hypothetical protein